MKIADLCVPDVVQIAPGASVREAAVTMRSQHVGSLVVTELSNGASLPVGILTDRDIVLAVVAKGIDADQVTVADIMTRALVTCAEDDALRDVLEIMRTRGVRRIPVVDARRALRGIVAIDDILLALSAGLVDVSKVLLRGQNIELTRRP